MKQRVISGLIVAAVLIFTGLTGGMYLYVLVAACSVIGLFEYFRATVSDIGSVRDIKNNPFAVSAYAALIVYYICILVFGNNDAFIYVQAVYIGVLIFIYVLKFPKYKITDVCNGIFAFIYCVVMMSYIYLTRIMPGYGHIFFWTILIGSSICDVCAYFVGVKFGKHRLAPVLSPKKSIEGSIGGIAGSVFVAFILGFVVLNKMFGMEGYTLQLMILCFFASICSQVGDLFASGIKREHDIKDFGTLIPGHGGILDRCDSMIFTAPIVYFVALLVAMYV